MSSPDTKKRRQRVPAKVNATISAIRQTMLDGTYMPGSMLPTRDKLVTDFKTSRATLQKSIDQLIQEGFIETNGTSGSFVSKTPPNLFQIGIVMYEIMVPCLVTTAIKNAIKIIESETLYRFKFYYLLTGYKEQLDMKELHHDLENHLLAGIISFHIAPSQLEDSGIFSQHDIPALFLIADAERFKPNKQHHINYIWFNYRALIDKIIGKLHHLKVTKVAWVVNGHFPDEDQDYLLETCKKQNIDTSPAWVQGSGLNSYECKWLVNTMLLLMDSPKKPEVIVVLDENLLEPVVSGLHKARISIPDDIQLISHCSFPLNDKKLLSIAEIGFDMHDFLCQGIEIINKLKKSPEYAEHSYVCIKGDGK